MENIELKIKTDSDSATHYVCPNCKKQFKLFASDVQNYKCDNMFCPYCGQASKPQNFIPEEIIKEGMNRTQNMINAEIEKLFSGFKSTECVKVEHQPLPQFVEKQLGTKETEDSKHLCEKCNKFFKTIKANQTEKLYCPYCGNMLKDNK